MVSKFEKIVLATNNQGKVIEFSRSLKGFGISFVPQSEFNVPDADETGKTYVENAIIKARQACEMSGLPAIGDDSGLEVDALSGAPGIYSQRFSGDDATPAKNIQKLLEVLKDVPDEKRTGRCKTILAFLKHENDPSPIICEGVWEISILKKPQGEWGFGYDPILYVKDYDCSAAELETEVKNKISHRGLALEKFKNILMSL